MDLQTLDAYIDSLRDELDETTLKSKTNFTLDMISQLKKTKCSRKFMGDHYIFLHLMILLKKLKYLVGVFSHFILI